MNLLAATTSDKQAVNQVYNVALSDRTGLNELYKMIAARLMDRVPGLNVGEPKYVEFRPGDVRHSQADIGKAKKLLGYQPSHKIAAGFDEAMDWYVARAN
jgi:UDP-N-acetylglucosamine/UDP-N-acetylgalactosamine 4-epimerase